MLLTTMNRKWSELGLEEWFSDVNHFSLNQLKPNLSTLTSFVEYCVHIRINGQNAQTIERALEVAHYVEKGISPCIAIRLAWDSYPLIEASPV